MYITDYHRCVSVGVRLVKVVLKYTRVAMALDFRLLGASGRIWRSYSSKAEAVGAGRGKAKTLQAPSGVSGEAGVRGRSWWASAMSSSSSSPTRVKSKARCAPGKGVGGGVSRSSSGIGWSSIAAEVVAEAAAAAASRASLIALSLSSL